MKLPETKEKDMYISREEHERILTQKNEALDVYYKLAANANLLKEENHSLKELLNECRSWLDILWNDMIENGESTEAWDVKQTKELFDKVDKALSKTN
jgi:hypothetical protein